MHARAAHVGLVHLPGCDLGSEQRTGHEQLSVLAGEDGEVRQADAQRGSPDDRSEHEAEQRHPAAALDQPVHQHAGSGERGDSVVRSLASSVPHGDDRRAAALGHLDDAGDLQRVHLAHAAAEDPEVLSEAVHRSSLQGSVSCDDPVAGMLVHVQVEVGVAMRDESLELDE